MRLLLLFLSFSLNAAGDDLIRPKDRGVWRVAKCQISGDTIQVTPCYSSRQCPKEYSGKDYICLRSRACGKEFLEDFALAGKAERFGSVVTDGVFLSSKTEAAKIAILFTPKSNDVGANAALRNSKNFVFQLKRTSTGYDLETKSGPQASSAAIKDTLIPCPE
ncbi:hypothetical protein K2X33_09905 [bacterium]|nr:hypothetical protein [bacterium]